MKKLLMILLGVAMMSIGSAAQAQQDTTSTEKQERTESQEKQTTDQELEEARDDMQEYLKHSSDKAKVVENKVGPNGEPIYLDEDGTYYYFNENGKKKRIKESKLKDKPDDN